MNKTNLIAIALLGFAAPAFAQEAPVDLQVESGTVMTSTGGEFQTAATGEDVVVGERVMVAENSSVLVRYANNCVIRFSQPGVHLVPQGCVPGVGGAMSASAASGSTGSGVFAATASGSAVDLVGTAILGLGVAGALTGVTETVTNDPVSP